MRGKEVLPATKNALRKTGGCLLDSTLPTATAFSGTMTGVELAQQDYTGAAIQGALTAGLIVCQRFDRRMRQVHAGQAFDAGYRLGVIETATQMRQGPDVIFRMAVDLPQETPLYTSLSGEEVITSPIELMEQFGSPETAVTRVGVILRHAEKRPLTPTEVETLRKAEAMLKIAPGFEQVICEDGQDMVSEVKKLTTKYEEEYRRDHPTT